jgi:predicted  nucleic acid-binding Zn-ribbon protein
MNQIAQQSERFRELLAEINDEVSELKGQIKELKKDNAKLKTKLAEARDKQTDIFSAINESERLAMRQHIQGLVNKIDNHLGSGS